MASIRLSEKLKTNIARNAGQSLTPTELQYLIPSNNDGKLNLTWGRSPMPYPTLQITDKDDPNFGNNGATNFAIERILPEDYTYRCERFAEMHKQFSDIASGPFRLANFTTNSVTHLTWTALIQLPLELIDFELTEPRGVLPMFNHVKDRRFPYDRFFVPCELELFFNEEFLWPSDWISQYNVHYHFSRCYQSNNSHKKDWKARKGTNLHTRIKGDSVIEYTLPLLKWEELPEKFQENIAAAINDRRQFLKGMEFRNSIAEVLEQCNSLKQFLDLWPQGDHLVPTDVLQKHKQKAVPKKAAAPKPQLSDEKKAELSVSLLRAKLGG